MAPVFREIELTWDGETYRVTPTMRLLNRIEQTVSLAAMAQRLAANDPPISHVAHVVGEFLRAGGARVSDEEVYSEILTGDQAATMDIASAVFMAVFPAAVGNGPRPARRGAKRKGAR